GSAPATRCRGVTGGCAGSRRGHHPAHRRLLSLSLSGTRPAALPPRPCDRAVPSAGMQAIAHVELELAGGSVYQVEMIGEVGLELRAPRDPPLVGGGEQHILCL